MKPIRVADHHDKPVVFDAKFLGIITRRLKFPSKPGPQSNKSLLGLRRDMGFARIPPGWVRGVGGRAGTIPAAGLRLRLPPGVIEQRPHQLVFTHRVPAGQALLPRQLGKVLATLVAKRGSGHR
jgi:hypothetical protein